MPLISLNLFTAYDDLSQSTFHASLPAITALPAGSLSDRRSSKPQCETLLLHSSSETKGLYDMIDRSIPRLA